MKCQFCKEKEATIYIQELFGNDSININVCDDCASKYNIIEDYLNLKSSDSFQNIKLKKKTNRIKNIEQTECSYCGYHITDYFDTLSLSCPNCYSEFKATIKNTVKNIHSKNKHKNYRSKEYIKLLKKENKIKQLEIKLNDLIREEEYEKAASVRDIINKEKQHILERA